LTPTLTPTPTITPTISITPTITPTFDTNVIYTGTQYLYVRGASGTPAYELNNTFEFRNFNPQNNQALYVSLANSSFNLYYDGSVWRFTANSDYGEFERAYFPWNSVYTLPNTTGWIKGYYGYGTQSDYNDLIIQKVP